MYILGNDASATSLCMAVNKIFDIDGFVVISNDSCKIITEKSTKPLEHKSSNKYILATNNIVRRQQFIDYFTKREENLSDIFPNLFFEHSHIDTITSLGYGNIFHSFSGIFGNASVGNFNYFYPYASAQFNSVINDNNILYSYASIGDGSTVLDSNILQSNAVINPDLRVGSHNIISSGESLFEPMENRELFQSGIITSNDNYL